MGAWSYYFFAKVYLYARGFISLDAVANLLFAMWVLLPMPEGAKRFRSAVVGRSVVNVIIGGMLLWHDSWLQPLSGTVAFFRDAGLPSKEFIYQIVVGALNPREMGVLALLLAACIAVRRYVRLTPLVFVLLVVVAVREFGQPKEPIDRLVASFYASEAARVLSVDVARSALPGADVVLLHVCSLSWDDLLAVGMDRDEFFSRFDVLFTRFNSVTSHSNPAAIRLLRAGCGQPPHDALYRPAQDDCYLFDVFRQAGYRPSFALNHDGRYGGLRDEIERLGHAAGEVDVTGAPVRQIDFNGSVIRDDFSVLNAWWKARQRAGAQPALLYYNTITLHDGGHGVGEPEWWKRDRAQRYRESARALFHDLDEFMTILESSGRRSVVVFVPEHGLALRGSKLQPPGVREVPLPQITTVPVGIKLIGPGWHRGRETPRRIITQPTSYFALASWLAAVLHWDGLQDHGVTTRIAVPSTDFLAENEAARVVQHGSDYLVNGGSFGTRWVRLGADVLPETIGGAGHASTVHTIETEGGT